MEEFSGIVPQGKAKPDRSERLSVTICSKPYLQDHHFMGKAVLPAVEAMQILADTVACNYPNIDTTRFCAVRFNKLLPLPPNEGTAAALVDIIHHDNGSLTTSLLTRKHLKKAAMSRLLSHVTLTFDGNRQNDDVEPPRMTKRLQGTQQTISAQRVYTDLVPFGPAYQNIVENVTIAPTGAWAKVHTPSMAAPGPLGSPFTLDAAFHAACVWGQCYLGYTAFPVGIRRRVIWCPTTPNSEYIVHIVPIKGTPERLMADIHIYDINIRLRETATGVEMRDVSGGQLKPPDWILRKDKDSEN